VRRLSRSCGKLLCWSRKATTLPTRSVGSASELIYHRWRQEYGGLKTEQVKRPKELEQENARLRRAISDLTLDKLICRKLPGETSKPRALPRLYLASPKGHACLERRAGAALGQHRSAQRRVPRGRDGEEQLTADLIALARQRAYGYRKIAGLLEQAGWLVNDKRVEWIWRREGLKASRKQPKRGRVWLADGLLSDLFILRSVPGPIRSGNDQSS
jgi:putative transposase